MVSQKQIEANRRNRKLWRGHTPEGLRRISESTKKRRPWQHSTGPKTAAGKARAAQNGGCRGQVRLTSEYHCLNSFLINLVWRLKRRKKRPRDGIRLPPGFDSLEQIVGRIAELRRILSLGD